MKSLFESTQIRLIYSPGHRGHKEWAIRYKGRRTHWPRCKRMVCSSWGALSPVRKCRQRHRAYKPPKRQADVNYYMEMTKQ